MTPTRFNDRLRASLVAAEVTSLALAKHLGVTPAAVSHWCTGYNGPPDADTILKIAAFLGVNPGALLFGTATSEAPAGTDAKAPAKRRGARQKPSGTTTKAAVPAKSRSSGPRRAA